MKAYEPTAQQCADNDADMLLNGSMSHEVHSLAELRKALAIAENDNTAAFFASRYNVDVERAKASADLIEDLKSKIQNLT